MSDLEPAEGDALELPQAPQFKALTDKQRAIAEAKLQDPRASNSAIARQVGSSPETVKKTLALPAAQAYLSNVLDDAGATLAASAAAIADAHKATKIKYFAHEGVVKDERVDVDHKIRLEAAELNLEARGELQKGDRVQTNNFYSLTDEQLAAVASGSARVADFIDTTAVGMG